MVLTGNSLVLCDVIIVSFWLVILLPGPFGISVLDVSSFCSKAAMCELGSQTNEIPSRVVKFCKNIFLPLPSIL